MELLQLPREETHFNNPFLTEFLTGNKLSDFEDVKASLDSVPEMVKSRAAFGPEKRKTLVKVLKEQYAKSKINLEGELAENIHALENSNTYTITTGQQIHLGLGPLYVLYKILNTIHLSKEINASYPEIKAVPVFWMATEDHDFEEIKSINIFNKQFDWETEAGGAVGRLSTEGILPILEQIEQEFNLSTNLKQFIETAKQAYSLPNYADASRFLIHECFGEAGLVVLDADNEELKKSFIPVVHNELIGGNHKALSTTSAKLEAQGFENQIYIRDINLFYLKDNARLRIEKRDHEYLAEGELLFTEQNRTEFIKDEIGNISPNVALRPLYQEMILPNLIYVGGPSEIKYWLQLESLFHKYNIKLPALYLRSSWVIIPYNKYSELKLSGLKDLYLDENELIERYSQETAILKAEVLKELSDAQEHIAKFGDRIEEIFNGFSLSGKINKLYPKLLELQNLSENKFIELGLNNPVLNKLQKLRNAYVSKDEPQERVKHIIEFSELISELQKSGHHSNFDNLLKINHLLTKSV